MPKLARFGYQRVVITQPCIIATGTSAEECLTDLVLGFKCNVEKVVLVVKTVGAGAGADRTINFVRTRGTTDATFATYQALLANVGTKGLVLSATLTPGNADFNDTDKLSIMVAAGGTQFTALEVTAHIILREVPQQKV